MIQKESHSYHSLLWATKRALLREVVPAMRGIAVDWKKGGLPIEDEILVYFYIDGTISEDLFDECSCIGTEVIANYSEGKINDQSIRLDYPRPLPKHNYWAYKRKEPNLEEENPPPEGYDDIYLLALFATLGWITPFMRGVALEENNNGLTFSFYVDGVISEELGADCKEIVDRFKRYSKQERIESRIVRMDFPQRLPSFPKGYEWIYKRKEVFPD